MEAGRRLVEDVNGAPGRFFGQLGGELHALRLAAGERGRRLSQSHITKPHVLERDKAVGDRGDVAEKAGSLREQPSAVVSPYDFEPEFQIFVTWLAQTAGLQRIRVDANNSRLGAWNGKRMLHPTVESALRLDGQVHDQAPPLILDHEHRASEAFQALRTALPVIPGYAVPWQENRCDFSRDLVRASTLLKERYGLTRGCLKPSEGGNGGRIVANIDAHKAIRQELLDQYKLTILTALRETADALVSFNRHQEQFNLLTESVDSARESARITRDRYANGTIDYQNVLDTERSLLKAEDAATVSQGEITLNMISLYKAIGGGWEHVEQDEPAIPISAKDGL